MLKAFSELPGQMQTDEIRRYYDILAKRKRSLAAKQLFDRTAAFILLVVLSPILLVLAIIIKCSSRGPIIFRQKRVGRYLKPFYIWKFRTMQVDAEKLGGQITVGSRDPRITKIGWILRKYRLDELPQLFNILAGQMSFVGARPEVPKYVEQYSGTMAATLLIRPGVTGYASIRFKDENELLGEEDDPERAYVEKILPIKMGLDLNYVEELSVITDIKTMLETVKAVF